MPFHGACALLAKPDDPRLFVIVKLRFDSRGRIDLALLNEIAPQTRQMVSAEEVLVSEVIELIRSGHQVRAEFRSPIGRSSAEMRFVVVVRADGTETITLVGTTGPGTKLKDIPAFASDESDSTMMVTPSFQHAYRARDRVLQPISRP